MKYYIADCDDPDFAASEQRYVDYIRAVWNRLPPELRRLCDRRTPFSPERVYLNDSTIQRVHADFREKIVEIVLLGECLDKDGMQTGSRLFTLKYGAVQTLTCDGDYDFPFGALHTDHVWDEIEILFGMRLRF